MGYRMLLGREAMSGRVLVDPDENNVLGKVTESQIHEAYQFLLRKRTAQVISIMCIQNQSLKKTKNGLL